MKKITMIIATLAIGFAFVACGGSSDSKKSDPASKVEETFNSLYDALDDDTPDNFIKIYEEMDELYESSSVDVQAKMDEASDRWYENNPSKAEQIAEALNVLYEMGLLK